MLFIPLPFVVALLLLILFVIVLRRDEEGQPNRPFLVLILLSALQSILSGLRWGYGMQAVGVIAPVIAATVPPLAYAGVSRLVRTSWRPLAGRLGLHAVPAVLILLLVAFWREAIDIALVLIFVGYALAILLRAQMRFGSRLSRERCRPIGPSSSRRRRSACRPRSIPSSSSTSPGRMASTR
ncbi:UNVERIFIED_ORG: hypothetical protein GGE44_001518 [Rhizobium esperanzae]